MTMADLAHDFEEFWHDLRIQAEATGDPQWACFFGMFAEAAADNGDSEDLTYAPVRIEGQRPCQVDGYALDQERGELYLAICDFRSDDEKSVPSLDQKEIDRIFNRAIRFFQVACDPGYINTLEETSPAFEVAYTIFSSSDVISRVRLILLSNGRLVARKKRIESQTINGKTFTYNLLDFSRYTEILKAKGGAEPIEIDLTDLHGRQLDCLLAHTGSGAYESYLAAVPAKLLAELYGQYGARLLEQNVRTFLQARTKVNKGIIQTIKENPEMFFAYNNGLTATASRVSLSQDGEGRPGIVSISGLQIVNGGQTTASILYAKDQLKLPLKDVFVQMKLSVIAPNEIESVVPNISRYANTQNKVNEADFFSTHPFHVEMEKISRRLPTPQRKGEFSSSKWFYERARGQYKDAASYKSPTEKRRFESEFPRSQLILKTDLAKYAMTFAGKPDLVSQGAQKCFIAFAETLGKEWKSNPRQFNERYFRHSVAKAISFRWTDRMVATSEWYKRDRGYKANIVTYTLAWLVNKLESEGRFVDLDWIWNEQDLHQDMKYCLESAAPRVADVIKSPPDKIRNVSEYAKRQMCWARVKEVEIMLPCNTIAFSLSKDEEKKGEKDAVNNKRVDEGIEFDVRILGLSGRGSAIADSARQRDILSPASESGLKKIDRGKLNLTNKEKQAIAFILGHLDEEGVEI